MLPTNTATVLFISFYIFGIGLTTATNSSRNMTFVCWAELRFDWENLCF